MPRAYALACLLGLAALLGGVQSASAQSQQKIPFNIPKGPASAALGAYIEQTGLQVVFPSDDVRGISTNEVRGQLDVVEALMRMTRGTRLRFEFIDNDAVTVTVMPPGYFRRKRELSSAVALVPPELDRRSLNRTVETVTIRSGVDRPSAFQTGGSIIELTRDDIQSLGSRTISDVLRTLPQVFGGGPSEDTRLGSEAPTNTASGTGVNLRGLGAGSTLVLVNGRRMAGGGSAGIFTDIMSLPVSLVERIEILPDSSSSIYGADAVGGVVNFILVDSMLGGEVSASYGVATRGPLDQQHISQLVGLNSSWMTGLLGLDFYSRDRVRASDRDQARSDLTAFGGDNFDIIQSNPGTVIVGGRNWGIPRGQDGKSLSPSSFLLDAPNRQNLWTGTDLLPNQQRWTAYASGKTLFSERWEAFSDLMFSQRNVRGTGSGARINVPVPTSNAFYANPVDPRLPLVIAYDFSRDLGNTIATIDVKTVESVLGAKTTVADDWTVTLTSDFARESIHSKGENAVDSLALGAALLDNSRATAFNPFGDGSYTNPATLASIRTTILSRTNSSILSGNLTAARAVRGVDGTPGKFVTGIDYREQSFDSQLVQGPSFSVRSEQEREVKAAFGTLTLPILGSTGREGAPNLLEVSAAGRYEHYSDFGSAFAPRLGLASTPLEGLTFRGTWSRSFRPPNLLDLDESNNVNALFGAIDPTAPGGVALVLARLGKNAELREERARSWTLGVDWNSTAVPGLSGAVTYFNTRFSDRMDVPVIGTSTANLLTDPELADRIKRAFTAEERRAICEGTRFGGGPTDACMTLPIAAIADLRVLNSALMQTNGVDLLAEYLRYTDNGLVKFRLDGTYILSFSEANSPNLPLTEKVSTQNNPIDLRLRGTASWQVGPWRTTALVTYFDDYRDLASTRPRHVRSWTTLDLNLEWSTGDTKNAPFSGMTFSLDAVNLFDRKPPFLNNALGVGYDQENADLLGRVVSVTVRKDW